MFSVCNDDMLESSKSYFEGKGCKVIEVSKGEYDKLMREFE